ncbi:MAG TPA: protein kinase [Candidatus Eisenbacteria bacterium]|nr:protein kinase [Candidatus Eisenbacteria bacterium]
MSSTQGETISHYRLIEPIGRGAMGEVWLAEDTQLPRRVAIKLLPRHLSQDKDAVDRLLREAQAAASVDHPAVVTVYEAGLAGDRPYLVMQRVEGETLEQRLTRGPMPVREAVALAAGIADALAEVHALGIVHRDLKPSNIILTARGPKVLDFGIASVKGSPRLTETGSAVGTPLSMSPEQVRGLPPDNRSDLWGLGVTLYQSLTGTTPFQGESLVAIAHQVLHDQPKPPSALRREVTPDLDYIVMKLLRKEPAHRYSRAEDLLADLASFGGDTQPMPARAGAAPAVPRLAVLYFEVLSTDADDAFVAAGLVEDLIVDLTQVGGVQVASRADVLPFRDRPLPPRTLARELGVDYVVSGSVRRAGNRARISAQLVRAADGHTMWAERFDRTLDDLFDVQAEVSKRIVEALQVALRPGERERLEKAPTRSKEAYALYLKARERLGVFSRESYTSAEALLRRALELDPDFALAHAALGECLVRRSLAWYAGMEVAEPAMAYARRALELEPDLFEGLLVVSMVHRLRGEHEAVLQMSDRLKAINPDHREAMTWVGWAYLTVGKPELALATLEPIVELHQDEYFALQWALSAYEMLNRTDDMRRATMTLRDRTIERLRHEPENIHARSILAATLVSLNEVEAGIQQAERAVAMAPDDGRIRYNAACTYARAGLADRALAELREGTRNLPSFLTDWPRNDPDLASLHDHPEFIRMFGKADPA